MARVVVPGYPRHVTQRRNRRQRTFFCDADYRALLAEECRRRGVAVWAYCLMPNHVHLIVVPDSQDGLRRAIGAAHRKYTLHVNLREDWRGHLWHGRFASFVMDEDYLLTCTRYVECNPVRAGLCARTADWPWSSATAHVRGRDDALVQVRPLLELLPRWAAIQRHHESSGRPLGFGKLHRPTGRRSRSAAAAGKTKPKSAGAGELSMVSPKFTSSLDQVSARIPAARGRTAISMAMSS